jgi:hypothetical protein
MRVVVSELHRDQGCWEGVEGIRINSDSFRVGFGVQSHAGQFQRPRSLTEGEIESLNSEVGCARNFDRARRQFER